MSDNEVAIAIIAIIFGSILGIIVIVKLFELIKTWINRNKSSYDEDKFERLAKAFIQYKKDTQRRLQNLEAIVTGEDLEADSTPSSKTRLQDTQRHNAIEIDADDSEKQEKESAHGSLRNMLKE